MHFGVSEAEMDARKYENIGHVETFNREILHQEQSTHQKGNVFFRPNYSASGDNRNWENTEGNKWCFNF